MMSLTYGRGGRWPSGRDGRQLVQIQPPPMCAAIKTQAGKEASSRRGAPRRHGLLINDGLNKRLCIRPISARPLYCA